MRGAISPHFSHPTWLLRYWRGARLRSGWFAVAGNPDGILQIRLAAKLATGDSSLTAVDAADIFERLLGPIQDELVGNLRESY